MKLVTKIVKIEDNRWAIELKTSGFWKESIPFFGKRFEDSDYEPLCFETETEVLPYIDVKKCIKPKPKASSRCRWKR